MSVVNRGNYCICLSVQSRAEVGSAFGRGKREHCFFFVLFCMCIIVFIRGWGWGKELRKGSKSDIVCLFIISAYYVFICVYAHCLILGAGGVGKEGLSRAGGLACEGNFLCPRTV